MDCELWNILFVYFISLFNKACFGVDINAYFKWLSHINCLNIGIRKNTFSISVTFLFCYSIFYTVCVHLAYSLDSYFLYTHNYCIVVYHCIYMFFTYVCLIHLHSSFFVVLGWHIMLNYKSYCILEFIQSYKLSFCAISIMLYCCWSLFCLRCTM